MDGIMRSIDDMGALIGPIIAGVMIDLWGNHMMYLALSLMVIVLAVIFFAGSKYMRRVHS